MRLNNKELNIVVGEIYKRVSQPIIDKNSMIEASLTVNDDVTKDMKHFKLFKKRF